MMARALLYYDAEAAASAKGLEIRLRVLFRIAFKEASTKLVGATFHESGEGIMKLEGNGHP